MKNSNKFFLIAILSAFALFISLETSSQGKNEEVTIVAPYKPKVTESYKINFNPSIPDQMLKFPELNYSIQARRISTTVTAKTVKTNKKPPEKREDLKRALIRAGFGNYLTPYLEVFFNSPQNEDYNFGFHYKHISSMGEINDYANSTYSENSARIYGERIFDKQTLGGYVSYNRNMNHYYGYIPENYPLIDLADDDIKHLVNIISAGTRLTGNNPASNAIENDIGLNYYYLSDNLETNEQCISADAMLGKRFEMFNITPYQTIGAKIGFNNYINNDSVSSYSGSVFTVSPFIHTDFNQFRFSAGFDLSFKSDSSSKAYFYPKIRAEMNIVKDALIIYGDISGNIQRMSYKKLYNENPYISPLVNMDYQNNQFVLSAGLFGNIAEEVNFLAEVSNSTIKDLPLFINDTIAPNNTFNVIYDDANLFRIRGELNYSITKNVNAGLLAEYNSYSMKNEKEAWHRPALKTGFTGNFMIQDKFIIGSELTYTGEVYAKVLENNVFVKKTIDPWIDLSLSFNYLITENISAFINLNNILNQEYQMYYNYPVQKINILAGAGFSF